METMNAVKKEKPKKHLCFFGCPVRLLDALILQTQIPRLIRFSRFRYLWH